MEFEPEFDEEEDEALDEIWGRSDLGLDVELIEERGAKVYIPDRMKASKAAYWKRIYQKRLKPAEAEFAKRFSTIVRAIQKDTVSSGELRNLKRWKKRLADEFRDWYVYQATTAQALLAKEMGTEKAARLFTKAKKKPASWSWGAYKYGEVDRGGKIRLDVDAMVEDHLDVLAGTLDTMDERLDRALEASPEGITAEDAQDLLDEEFEAILDNGHIDDIATTEASWAENVGRLSEMARREVEWHDWATAQDDKVRETHQVYGAQGAVPVGTNWARFVDEDYTLRWPHDDECDEAGEIVNCRCIALPAVSPEDASEEEIASFLEDAA